MKDTVRERYAHAATSLEDAPDGTPPTLGLGDVVDLAAPQPGETVLDLGSGPGRDLFAAAERVGSTGRAIGVDMTPEMLERSRAAASDMPNVSIISGDLERLPLPCASVDVVISNCVINLVSDKRRALIEAFRVLTPGGRFAVLDTAFETEPGDEVRADADAWSCCVAGSLVAADYEATLREIGFTDVQLEWEDNSCSAGDLTANAVAVTATKPAATHPGAEVRPAVPSDLPTVRQLLQDEGLPSDVAVEDTIVALADGKVIGAVALERTDGPTTHLRSLVVAPEHRNTGLGLRLIGGALDVARWTGAEDVYLFTPDAADYFAKIGFEPVGEPAAREALPGVTVAEACCGTTAMRLNFERADLPMLGQPSGKELPTFSGGGSCC